MILLTLVSAVANAEKYTELVRTETEGFDALAEGLQKVYKRGRKMSKTVHEEADAESFHEWRKRVKYLRYHLDTLSTTWPPMMNLLEDELHKLTDSLGTDHDLLVLHKLVLESHLTEKNSFAEFFDFVATQRKIHQEQALHLGQKLYYWKPNDFTEWMKHLWNTSLMQPQAKQEDLVTV